MGDSPVELEISTAPADARQRVLQLLYSGLRPSERDVLVEAVCGAAERGECSLEGLLLARRGETLAGSVWGRLLPGRTAMIWPPQLAPDEPEATAQALLRRTHDHLIANRARFAQALIEPDGVADRRLLDAGYQRAADLKYLVCPADSFPRLPPRTSLQFTPCDPDRRGRLARIIEQTYEQTRDLPALNGIRDMDEVLDGYQHTGVFAPERWLIVGFEGRDVGCLLLTDHPAENQWELIYMGLAPAVRGRGWGLQITRHAQWLARGSGRARIVLAADAANRPALEMYAQAGFRVWDRRSVFLRFF